MTPFKASIHSLCSLSFSHINTNSLIGVTTVIAGFFFTRTPWGTPARTSYPSSMVPIKTWPCANASWKEGSRRLPLAPADTVLSKQLSFKEIYWQGRWALETEPASVLCSHWKSCMRRDPSSPPTFMWNSKEHSSYQWFFKVHQVPFLWIQAEPAHLKGLLLLQGDGTSSLKTKSQRGVPPIQGRSLESLNVSETEFSLIHPHNG